MFSWCHLCRHVFKKRGLLFLYRTSSRKNDKLPEMFLLMSLHLICHIKCILLGSLLKEKPFWCNFVLHVPPYLSYSAIDSRLASSTWFISFMQSALSSLTQTFYSWFPSCFSFLQQCAAAAVASTRSITQLSPAYPRHSLTFHPGAVHSSCYCWVTTWRLFIPHF